MAEARFVAEEEEEGKDMILDPTSSEGGNKERGETATAAFSFPLTAPRGESPSCNTTTILRLRVSLCSKRSKKIRPPLREIFEEESGPPKTRIVVAKGKGGLFI